MGRASPDRGKEESLSELELTCLRRPDDPDAQGRLGTAYYRAGRLDGAERCFRRAVELDPGSPAFHNNLGNVLCDSGKLSEGIAEYRRALDLAGGGSAPEARLNLDLALMEQRIVSERISFFEGAVALRVDSADSRCALGCGYLLRGDHRRALAEFRRALELDPAHHQAAVNLIFTYTVAPDDEVDFKQALADAGAACENHPGDALLLIHASELFECAGDLEAAKERMLRALEIDVGCLEAYDLAARLAEICPDARGDIERAVTANVTDSLRALDLGPVRHFRETQYARTLVGRARFDGSNDSWRSAEEQVRSTLERFPESPDAIRLAAEITEKYHGDRPKALGLYERAAALAPRSHEAALDLGAARLRMGRLKEALDSFVSAGELAPADASVFQALRFAMSSFRRVKTAELRFELAAKGGPDAKPLSAREESDAQEKLGRTYMAALMYDDARSHLTVAASLDPDSASAQSALGRLYARTGDYDEARRRYERALELDGSTSEAERGLAALAVRTGRFEGIRSLRPGGGLRSP